MTAFDRLARAAHAPHRRLGGEPVTVSPRAKVGGPNGAMGVDATRVEMVAVTAIISTAHATLQTSDAQDPRADNRLRVAGTVRTIEFAVAALAWQPRTGDVVTRADGTAFEVRGPGRLDDHGHVVYDLVLAGTP